MSGYFKLTFNKVFRFVLIINLGCSLTYGEIRFITPPIALPSLGFATAESYASVATADFNGDGYIDVVAPFGIFSGGLKLDTIAEVFLSNGPRTYVKSKVYLPNAVSLHSTSIVILDFNNDGIDDFGVYCTAYRSEIAGNYRSEAYQIVTYITQRGSGGTTFIKGKVIPLSPGAHDIKVVDTNWDGLLDITAALSYAVMGSSDGHLTVRNTGGGRFAGSWVKTHGTHFSTMFQLLGDFNFDGQIDALVTGTYYSGIDLKTTAPKTYLVSNLNDAQAGMSGPIGVEDPSSPRLRLETKSVLVSQDSSAKTSRIAASVGASLRLFDVTADLRTTILSTLYDPQAASQGFVKAVCPIGVNGDKIILAANGPLKFFSIQGGNLTLQSSITVKYDWNAAITASKELGFNTSGAVIDNNRIVSPDGLVCRDMDKDGVLDIVFSSSHGAGILYGSK